MQYLSVCGAWENILSLVQYLIEKGADVYIPIIK